jgi:5-methylthioadenosine/S-adenosylhomocysteine deaminase
MSPNELAIRAAWLLESQGGPPQLVRDRWIHVRGNRIEAVTKDPPSSGVQTLEVEESLVLPGFINLHSHVVNGAMFRGVPDDARFEAPWMSRLIYQLLMPLGDIALTTLAPQEVRSLVTLGMLDVLKGGTTTLVDNFSSRMEVFFDVAEELGIRAYGAVSGSSAGTTDIGPDGMPKFEIDENDTSAVDKMAALVKRYEKEGARVRAMLGPHAPDTCAPKLLRGRRTAPHSIGAPVSGEFGPPHAPKRAPTNA